jgi:CxxC motif-containing protein (DUF1111 family)
MNRSGLERVRRRIGYVLAVLIVAGTAWALTPGLPVLWAPRASAAEKLAGQQIFEHVWEPYDKLAGGDGLGPVFNARSCVTCHFQGGVGGGGGNQHNVVSFEAHPTKRQPEVRGGLVHKFAVANRFLEDHGALHELFPVIKGGIRIEGGCQILIRDFDPIRTENVNSTALFGAGWIDRLSSKSIVHNSLRKSVARIGQELDGKLAGILPGRPRVLPDGRVGKFGWKAQFATLEDFVAAACANEIGLGNPRMEQAKPLRCSYPKIDPDLNDKQFRALVAFVDTLPRPTEVLPSNPQKCASAERGKVLFSSVGCAACHVPDIGGVSGVYSDFLLHRLDDRRNGGSGNYGTVETPEVPLPEDHPLPDEWKTPPLWGVADSAPYFHDGRSGTLREAILRHHGNAQDVTDAFDSLPSDEQNAIITFLETLKAPADAPPAKTRPRDDLALAH